LNDAEAKLGFKQQELVALAEEKKLAAKVHQAEISEKEVEIKSLKAQLKEATDL
jgi:hypothetical protein